MNRRPTIKDIAREAGVSTGTVHLVLHDKKGISDETRERVRAVAAALGYRPNAVAAGLKRSALRIAVVLPVKSSMNRFYFSYQWDAVRDFFETLRDYNVEMLPVPYYGSQIVPAEQLDQVLEELRPDGLICAGILNARSAQALQRYHEAGVPVVLIGTETPECLCSVSSPFEILGGMVAEQLAMQTKGQDGQYLIGVGSAFIESHTRMVDGFVARMKQLSLADRVIRVSTEALDGSAGPFIQVLRQGNCIGCCAVTARDSVALAQALTQTGLAGTIPAIGSDIFPENVESMKQGVFNNLIQKNPYQQAWVAAQLLTDYLMSGKRPPKHSVLVGAEMVYASSLPLYDNGFYRLLT